MKSILLIVGLVVAILGATAIHAQPQSFAVEDLLESRWFDIELIVFERLNVLDVNTAEDLIQTKQRSWPDNLIATGFLTASVMDSNAAPIAPALEYCLGYPLFPDKDPIHPNLLRAQQKKALMDDYFSADIDAFFAEAYPAEELEPDEPRTPDLPEDLELPALDIEIISPLTTTNQPLVLLAPRFDQPPVELGADISAESEPSDEEKFISQVADFEALLYQTSYLWLSDLTLRSEFTALNRQRDLRPLIHRRWRQPVPPRNAAQPIYFTNELDSSAGLTALGLPKLEGFISVTVERYLHFSPTLWYNADTLGLAPQAFPAQSPPALPINNYMIMQESRRLRSGELHYLDHPKFGVIVRINPVPVPKRLKLAEMALNASS